MGKTIELTNFLNILSIMVISFVVKDTCGRFVAKDLIDKYQDIQLKIYVSGFETVSLENGENFVYITKCGRKQLECDASTQYCDTAAEQCMNCANLCLAARTSSKQVKNACEKQCPVYLLNESKKQMSTTTSISKVTTENISKDEKQNSKETFKIFIVVSVTIVFLMLMAIIICMMYICYQVRYNNKKRRHYLNNILPTDCNKALNINLLQTAMTEEQRKIKPMEDKHSTQPASATESQFDQNIQNEQISNNRAVETEVKSLLSENSQTAEYRKPNGERLNAVTSNEDNILAPSSTESITETVAKINSTSSAFQTSSSKRQDSASLRGNDSAIPLLNNESSGPGFTNT